MKKEAAEFFRRVQDDTCARVEALDGSRSFISDEWQREDLRGGEGGGGITRVLRNGAVFEQAGVNFSEVHGIMPAELAAKLTMPEVDTPFYATGISLVFHPSSPLVPTTHANFRYLEVGESRWFGGGMDLTPYYLFDEDAVHFHTTLKEICDRHSAEHYRAFKKKCDSYFYLPHRKEARGIGGIFFDYLGKNDEARLPEYQRFVEDLGKNFLDAYSPIVERRKDLEYSDAQKQFQLLRRGRYVEFNLVYDRGTLFGLKTNGRTESILMSLPPLVRWEYRDDLPCLGPEEARLIEVLRTPVDWV